MKKILLQFFTLLFFFSQYNGSAQTSTYSQQFFNATGSTAQCAVWDTWRATLTPGVYLKMTIYGTNDLVGQTCTDPVVVNAMAAAIKTNNTTSTCNYASPMTNGHVWSVCNRYNGEVWLDPPACCSGSNCPSPNAYILRPCIGGTNSNWGGVNTATCGAPTQIMAIEFWYGFPCTDTPKTELIGPGQVCPNRPYIVKPVKFFANATYNWQYSFNGTSWSNYTGSVDPNSGGITDFTASPKWYRCKIACNANSYFYTTPPILVNIAPFYYCYCVQGATSTAGLDVGNVKVIGISKGDTLLNWGNPLPLTNNTNAKNTYSGLQDSTSPVILYKDSLYRVFVSQITSASSASAGRAMVYIDYNRDGLFDQGTELVMNKAITNPSGWDSIQFKVPATAEIGLTGLRVVLRNDTLTDPCVNYGQGETEDYLAEIRHEPCKGVPEVGKTEGDTTVCFGYDYLVTDTTYERLKSEVKRAWQVSADNVLWFAVPNSTNKDTLMRIFTGQPLYYRMQVVCDATHDTAFSPAMLVNQKAAYKCYCYSQAVGGKFLDSSDIGGFSLAGYANNDGGTHLDNPKATRKRTDHTDEPPIVIDVDSNYNISTFHTMRKAEHADAKITIFMDFNNNHTYDIAAGERVFTGFTSVGNFTLIDRLTVQKLAILNVPTGMRVILNNDIAPNIPSDEACGPYTSGETEDYMVIFRKSFPTTINDMGRINNVSLYPNPTTGKFILQFSSNEAVKEVTVTITNVTGQKISEELYPHTGGQFTKELDLTGRSKGVYFVELKSNGQKVVSKLVVQ